MGRDERGHDAMIARRCERAVVTAYRELRGRGTPDLQAFGACTTLYRIHHPEASLREARLLVAEWCILAHHTCASQRLIPAFAA